MAPQGRPRTLCRDTHLAHTQIRTHFTHSPHTICGTQGRAAPYTTWYVGSGEGNRQHVYTDLRQQGAGMTYSQQHPAGNTPAGNIQAPLQPIPPAQHANMHAAAIHLLNRAPLLSLTQGAAWPTGSTMRHTQPPQGRPAGYKEAKLGIRPHLHPSPRP
jgi:hypothetical protein